MGCSADLSFFLPLHLHWCFCFRFCKAVGFCLANRSSVKLYISQQASQSCSTSFLSAAIVDDGGIQVLELFTKLSSGLVSFS